MRTRIKFCGITRERDLEAAVRLGVDAVGLVFAAGSPRCLASERAARLRSAIPAFVCCVALFRNPSETEVRRAIDTVAPDLLQFHGEEPAEFCSRFGRPYVKAFAMRGAPPSAALLAAHTGAAGILLDGHGVGESGGQGRAFDWSRARRLSLPVLILAGGLTADTVGRAIVTARPYAVDVSSGIEADPTAAPGIKDFGRMKAFVAAVRETDASRPPFDSDSPPP